MIGVSPFAKIILSEAKDLGVRAVEILRYAQDDDFGGVVSVKLRTFDEQLSAGTACS